MDEDDIKQEEPEFDAAQAAADLEAERAAGGGQDDPEPDEDDDDGQDDEPEPEPEPEKKAPTATEQDDVDAFLKANGQKPISVEAFKKRLAREKQKYEEAAAWKPKHDTLATELENYRKTQPLTPQQAELYKQYEGVYGKLREGTKNLPFLGEAIAAIAKGQSPDLRKLNQALSEHVSALPEADPRLLQQQQELAARLDRAEELEFDRSFQSHIEREERAVSQLLGATPDPELVELIEEVYVSMIPEKGDLSKMPDKVKIAKLLLSRDSKLEQRILKKQIPAKPVRRAAIPAGGGPAARTKPDEAEQIPEPGTPEWDAWTAEGYKQRA